MGFGLCLMVCLVVSTRQQPCAAATPEMFVCLFVDSAWERGVALTKGWFVVGSHFEFGMSYSLPSVGA
jgi:hypothetical protein